ncbi:hypothetical protein NP493_8722g00000 [Ridgeia piscesae]|uniref:Uncharacterized protein n=1 Tax=Ridgeia piscesae TaxID=27915 RepID=A0AAD9IPZ4_RIDPI|nr:hypothetical protein NP493_8722g00000 [Ridgeia piscesae]
MVNKALLLQAKHLNSHVNYAPGVAVTAGAADAADEDEADEEDEEGKGNEYPPQIPLCEVKVTTRWWSGYWYLWWILIAFALFILLVSLILICCICCPCCYCYTRYHCGTGVTRSLRSYCCHLYCENVSTHLE